jgi:hypothetical protein
VVDRVPRHGHGPPGRAALSCVLPHRHARRCRTPLGGATGKPVLGRGGLRSACRAGRACASLGHGVGNLVTHIGGGLQRVRVRVSGEGEGEGEGENEGEW